MKEGIKKPLVRRGNLENSQAAKTSAKASGSLFIVASPIGNLRDITLRALDILGKVAFIAAEDTRRSRKLLSAYDIKTRLVSLDQHSERTKAPLLLKRIIAGEDIAYLADAGTPGISDPGFSLINAALTAGVPVVPIPGVSAALTALCVSGLPMNRFLFIGFLPSPDKARKHALENLQDREESIILFESPLRLLATLKDLLAVWGERQAFVAREMTKLYEEFQRGSLSELISIFAARGIIKGEVTIVVGGKKATKNQYRAALLKDMLIELTEHEGLSNKEAVQRISTQMGIPKSTVYRLSLDAKGDSGKKSE